jgi:Ras-related protein Rab-8A
MGDSADGNRRQARVCIAGESGIGKTCFCNALKTGIYDYSPAPTVGASHFPFELPGGVLIDLFDTAGQEKYRSMTTNYFRGAAAGILAYDISSPRSLDGVTGFYSGFRDAADPDARVIVVGLKADLADTADSKVSIVQAEEFVAKLAGGEEIPVIEVSAKANSGIEDFKRKLADLLQDFAPPPAVTVDLAASKKKKACC